MLQFESGGYQVSNAAVLLTRVIEVKPDHNVPPRYFVGVDAAMTMFSSKGATSMASEVLVVGREREGGPLTDVVGQSCNYDSLAEGVAVPTPAPGDLLVLLAQGAYGDVTGNQMNALSRPAVVLVDDARSTLAKRREELEDVTRRNILPFYLWRGPHTR